MTTVEIGEFRWGFDQKKVGYLMASHDVGYGALKIPKTSKSYYSNISQAPHATTSMSISCTAYIHCKSKHLEQVHV